jgi:hypothetical protein
MAVHSPRCGAIDKVNGWAEVYAEFLGFPFYCGVVLVGLCTPNCAVCGVRGKDLFGEADGEVEDCGVVGKPPTPLAHAFSSLRQRLSFRPLMGVECRPF